ncbi:MAG: DUF434 domain-containing protein [Thermoguttaceae bacterium]
MPDTRSHRGPHPEDLALFGPHTYEALRQAAADLCWLLNRGYAARSALTLVGDRYQLHARQRVAVARVVCSDTEASRREAHRVNRDALRGRPLLLDGYNVLTTVEAALAGGVILRARDGTYRDMASMHGSYRKVAETWPALDLIGRLTAEAGPTECRWYLDRAVSNSGRLKQIMEEVAAAAGWRWSVELVPDPDPLLSKSPEIVVTADSAILDACHAWFNLARETIDRYVPQAWVVSGG